MSKSKFALFVKNTQNAISRHSPEILTGLGIAGMLTTTVLAVKATPKALRSIEDAEYEKGEKLTIPETVKVCWKHYIPAAATGVTATACLIGANKIHISRTTALAAAYKLSETALDEYREKVVETLGEKKERNIRDKVAEQQVKNNPASRSEIIVTGNGDTRFFDPMSGRHFFSSIEKIKKAENELNKEMLHNIGGYMSLNDFYDAIDVPHADVGEVIGWNTDNLIDMDVSAQVDDDGMPSIVLEYLNRPEYGYDQ